ncbi:MAG: DNRLRE domain-containing protein, partial [Acutalibacteraceae bacterium]|nr:DNRLRE domain-containing protein [Acutalibacteraceae bacterium]
MKTLKKTIAIFLVMLTIFTTLSAVMPVLASSELVTAGNVTSGNAPETETEPEEEPEILSEIIEKREENAKHFLMSDGSFMVAQYPTAVHYQNDSEEWVDYNNNVKDTQATTEQVELFGTDELYSTSNLLENVVFAEKSNSNTLVSYEAKDYPISFNYQSAKKSNIKIIENETELTGNDAFLTLPDITQEVLYENVFDGVDLQYIVSPDNLKENIIIKNKSAQNSFTVNYNIGELSAQVVDDKTINLMSGSEVIYTISAPYMYDANGEKSEGITLTVDKNKNGKLRVDITVDSQWLQAENRAYPVVVDPTIETKTDRDAIDSVMIAKSCGNTNYSAQSEMVVGYEGSEYGQCRVLVKFTLPALNKGDIIVDARLNLFNTTLEYYYSDTADMQVNAHMLTGEWSLTGVTWNNQPTYDSIVADYNIFKKGTGYNWRYFNITQIAKEWYNDPTSNNGILLKSSTEVADKNINGVKAKLYSEKYNSVENHYPSLSLTYRNNKGIEDFWSYTTLSAGSAGTAYINDYTGNLVFIHGDVATTGELMPVSLEHVYNGYMADKNASTYPHSGRGNKLSLQQTVKASGIADYPYIYEDGDGTQHYFYKKTENGTTKYIDEDGLNLELKIVSGGGYTITDKSDNVMTFNTSGLLTQIADAEGRKATLTYATEINTAENEKPFLKTITDGAGHKITLTYNTGANGGSNCQLKSITGPDGKTLTYNTSDGKRSKVTYPDGTYSTYTYDSDGALLTAKSSDGYKLTFTYGTDGAKRVTSVTESVGDSLGQKIVFSRNKVNQTVIETAGDDAVFGNSDDLITTYQFDNFGRTVSTKMKLRDGTSLGAEKYNYTGGSEGGGTDIGKRNRISSSAAMGKNINNLLINHNFENTDDWASTYWLNSSYNSYGTAEITNAYKYNGEKSVKITVNDLSSVTVDGGMAMHQAAGICSSPGTYTFSAYIKTNGVTVREGAERGGACLAVRITDENGDYIRQYSEMLTDTTDTSLDNGWQRIHFTFEVPDGAALCRVYPLLYNAKGTAYFDCAQLEKNSTVNTYNLLQNASFENGTENWSVNNCGDGEGISTAINNGGSKSFKFIGNAGTEKYIRQTVYVSGSEKDTYILSGYVRAFAVPLDMEAGRRMDISVKINYEGGTSKIKRPTIFNSAVPGSWQYASGVFNLSDEDDSTTKTPESIIVYCGYRKQANACYFDDISLVKEPAPTYTYDEDGNLISASENAEKNTNLSYDANDNLKSFTDERNAQYEYKYAETGNKHRLLSATNKASGVKYAYSYYGSGTGNNLKAQEIVSGSGNYIIRTSTVYTDAENGIASGAYVRRESNQHGYSTYYNYNKQSGLLMSVTDAEDNRTEYDYDENNGNITSVTAGGKTVGYTYDSSKTKLTQITHNGFNYGFTYDAFGNILSTKVGSQPLMTNEYQANNGKLTKSTYGNGDYKEYTYNDYGQTVRINENNKNAFYWRYNNTGYPYMHTDYNSGRVYYYTYDSLGRVIREFEKTYGEEE